VTVTLVCINEGHPLSTTSGYTNSVLSAQAAHSDRTFACVHRLRSLLLSFDHRMPVPDWCASARVLHADVASATCCIGAIAEDFTALVPVMKVLAASSK
jgi:hypothetical protein